MKDLNERKTLCKTLKLLDSNKNIKEACVELCIDCDAYLDFPEVRMLIIVDKYSQYGIVKTFSLVENGANIYDTYKQFIFDRMPEQVDSTWLLEHGFLPYFLCG